MAAKFTCPDCGAVSYNQGDIREEYCARCHAFVNSRLPPVTKHRGPEDEPIDVLELLVRHGSRP
jgi:hypothetical protein